ncbi:MAG TPA: carboxypeptidase-like regulatory domain-containing protein, partial [Anaerolineales bacterium]|nr:carboxypeptidase-like regulatory domain-containing protein [Anaerolineales bacterium]
MKRSPQILTILFVLCSALVIATNVAFSSTGLERTFQPLHLPFGLSTATPASDLNSIPPVFLPFIAQNQNQFSISGMVSDQQNRPVPGVEVVDQTGRSVVTGQDGSYEMVGLSSGEHSLAPSKSGLVFSPAVQDVDLPGNAGPVDFTAITACTEAVTNGGFESDTGWDFPVTPYPADYTTAVVHSGS